MTKNEKKIFRILLDQKKYIFWAITILFISITISMLTPLVERTIVDDGLIQINFNVTTKFAIILLLLTMSDHIISFCFTLITSKLNVNFTYYLNKLITSKFMRIRIDYVNKKSLHEIISNCRLNVSIISELTNEYILYSILSLVKVVGGIVGIIIIDYKLIFIIGIMIPIKYALVCKSTKIRDLKFKEYIELNKKYSKWYVDRFTKVKEIRLINQQATVMEDFEVKIYQLLMKKRAIMIVNSLNSFVDLSIMSVLSVCIYVLGGFLLKSNLITVGGVIASIAYSAKIIIPLSSLINLKYELAKISISIKELYDFLDARDEYSNQLSLLVKQNSNKILYRISNLCFSYNGKDKALNNVSFTIFEGEKIGIVGANGSGKSTILDILLCFYDNYIGEILFKGNDMRKCSPCQVRDYVYCVTQTPILFSDSIFDNLLQVCNDENYIQHIIEECDLFSLIGKKINLDHQINHNLTGISGGELRILAILKAVLSDKKVVFFDEPTAAMDISNKSKFIKTLDRYINTAVVITHDLDVIKSLDKIVFLDHGEVKSIGNHNELMTQGEYQKFIQTIS